MIQPSLDVLKAIASLITNSDFVIFINWIKESEMLIMRNNLNLREELQLRWNQGKLQNMNDILTATEEVFVLIEAHKQYVPTGVNPDI